MPNSDMSQLSSEQSSVQGDIENMILDEPMYYILSQFFETENHKNVATLLNDLVNEIRELRKAIVSSSSSKHSSS